MTKSQRKKKRQQYSLPAAGSSPGTVFIDDNSLEPRIVLHTIAGQNYGTESLKDLSNKKEKITKNKYTTIVK